MKGGRVADSTAGTAGVIVNGMVSHRNFACRSREYVDLDSGTGFVNEFIVKADGSDILAKEFAKSGWWTLRAQRS